MNQDTWCGDISFHRCRWFEHDPLVGGDVARYGSGHLDGMGVDIRLDPAPFRDADFSLAVDRADDCSIDKDFSRT